MPSMFNRRSRSVSTSRPGPPTSNSAHTAAAQAFLASRASQSNLSASAAAAALRTMSPAPTPVAQVQTKRMLQKTPSNSSLASAPRGRSRGGLTRTPSGGSMTDRTFRSPSVDVQNPGAGRGAPPIPSLPTTYTIEDVPPIPQKSHRRSSSMEVPPTRVLSPPPTRSTGRVQPATPSVASSAATLAARRSAAPPIQSPELERTDSRNSINFSYPRGSRPNSPPPSSPVAHASPAAGISAAETAKIQRSLAQTAATPVKKKKKIVQHDAAEGSHLQAGTVTSKTAGSNADTPQSKETPPSSRPKKAAVTGEGTHFSGNQSEDDTHSPSVLARTQRASGALGKQPSVVREDWDGEQDGSKVSPVPTLKTTLRQTPGNTRSSSGVAISSTPAANTSRKLEEVTPSPRQSTYDSVTVGAGSSSNGLTTGDPAARMSSVSPSRSTRFSDRLSSDLSAGKKHSPLPRSISPAKSALKHHSPARGEASPTDGRFSRQRNSSVTPSEASETSVDGRRKKSARVSFEASPEVRRTVMPAPIPVEEDEEEGLKPRPALPAFGSVRKTKPKDASGASSVPHYISREATTTASSSSSDTSSVREPSTIDTSVSSDHAIGGLLAREYQKVQAAPLPPQVTSVEGSGYVSDSDSESEDVAQRSHSKLKEEHIPVIAVQPATPGLEEDHEDDFTDGAEDSAATEASTYDQATSGLGIADDKLSDAMGGAVDPTEIKVLNTITEEDTDAESIYSDAAEELDGDGFGSINAIVGSPIPVSPSNHLSSAAETPVQQSAERPDAARVASWEGTQLRWSEIAQQFRDSAQQSQQKGVTTPSDGSSTPEQRTMIRDSKTLQPAAEIEPPVATQRKIQAISPVPVSKRSSQAAPKSSMPVAQSSAASSPAPTRTTRSKPSGGFRTSMRSPPEQVATVRVPPRTMRGPPPVQNNTTLQQSVPVAPSPTPLARTFSNDSDSDSSFKRARRARRSDNSKFAMRRSMRGEPAAPVAQLASTVPNRRDVRSASPVERRPLSPISGQRMRMSMRGSQDMTPTLRNKQPERKRSSSLFSLGRKAKSPTRPASIVTPTSRSKSRVVDSDDERDNSRRTIFKSRFHDSSDDEDYETLRPVRGIPKNAAEGDSTDLDDSSDDQRRKTKAAPSKLAISLPPATQPLSPGPMSPNTAKKLGLWGRLRGKKEEKSYFDASPSTPQAKTPFGGDNKGLSKDDKQLGFHSANERDLLIEQTRLKLEAARAGPSTPTGKLQRRTTPQRVMSGSWPLPPKTPTGEDRPFTSDGVERVARPELGERQPTSDTVATAVTAGGSPVYGRSGKKKRFPLLRRAFGLHD